ncbi:Uncharacterised protein [Salmonella enterica subsp. enterica serovar Typhi]|nr:Uncharacterised protein [Salmonella enterica subsp. enterica serovar Typhi]
MQCAARNNKYRDDEQGSADKRQRWLLRLHHSNGAAQDTVENVVERVAADIQIDGQPFNAADFLRHSIWVSNNTNDHHQHQEHFAAHVFYLD